MSYIGNEPIVSATRTVTEITATAGQTTFTANGGYTVGYIDVFVNGAQLQTSDFTADNGTSVTLSQAAAAGDDIRLVAWGTFSTSNLSGGSLVDASVSTAKLADSSVTTGKVANSAITPAKLSSNAQFMGFKNRIINGAMQIDQRYAGASVTPTDNQYSVDRWICRATAASKYSIQQSSIVPSGFRNSIAVTSLSAYSVGSTDFFEVDQRIEGFNVADLGWGAVGAQTVTLSFWVRSSLTGTFGGSLRNTDSTRCYPFTYAINSANTWEQKTVTVAGDTTGTWNTSNGIGLQICFGLGSGSTYSGPAGAWAGTLYTSATGATSVVGTNGATFYITGVQLEVGSTATSFDYRPYGTELALCYRYCQPNSAGGGTFDAGGTSFAAAMPLQVTMRGLPSCVVLSSSNAIDEVWTARRNLGGTPAPYDGIVTSSGFSGGQFFVTAPGTAYRPANWIAGKFLLISEL